jgi:hypothetical protein
VLGAKKKKIQMGDGIDIGKQRMGTFQIDLRKGKEEINIQ